MEGQRNTHSLASLNFQRKGGRGKWGNPMLCDVENLAISASYILAMLEIHSLVSRLAGDGSDTHTLVGWGV